MNFKYKGKDITINFDRCSESLLCKVNRDKIMTVSSFYKIYFLEKSSISCFYALSNNIIINCEDEDILSGNKVLKTYDFSKTFGFDFEKNYDYQSILLKSGFKIDSEIIKIRRSIYKKTKMFEVAAVDLFQELCKNKIPCFYSKCELRLISGILNNFIYKNKVKGRSGTAKIKRQFVKDQFEVLYEDTLNYNKRGE